jgi:hypothetical protein
MSEGESLVTFNRVETENLAKDAPRNAYRMSDLDAG